jgi:hypothetical protein
VRSVATAQIPGEETRDRALFIFGLCGILSVVFLVIAVILGAELRDDYDSVQQSMSELYEVGADNAHGLMVLFTLYHALVIPLAIGLHRGLPSARVGWLGPWLLGLAGGFGVPLGAYARCDPGCFGATTFRGQLHGILVLVTVALILGAMGAIWRRLAHHPKWRGYARYTAATALVALLFGLAMIPFIQGAYTGLLERISVGIIVQWYVVMGALLISLSRGRKLAVR